MAIDVGHIMPTTEETEAGTIEKIRITSIKVSENLASEENIKLHEMEIADTKRNENRKTTRKRLLKIRDEVDVNVTHTFSGLCYRCCYWFGLAFLAFIGGTIAVGILYGLQISMIIIGVVGVWIGITRQVMEKRGKKRIVVFIHKFILVSSVFIILPWYVVGCVWLYHTYEPEYEDKSSPDYCHKSLYLFAFFFQSILFMFICLLILLEMVFRFIKFYRLFKNQ
ncbi:uncharacterized protein LOC143253219 isoform X3 [Tachypleus tridentatus]|uniref:uncharacterized protein LOC143253219 isoform X3 n=1 Tax=Tachypleus tridentatus TaxID=6853 RepID=UPI003FD2CB9F